MGRRAIATCLALAVLGLPTTAQAKMATDCSGLQAAFDGAAEGDVITLDEMCVGMTFTLPATKITLKGTSGAGFDGQNAVGPLLSGTDVSTTTIKNLDFLNGQSTGPGGAISITGASAPSIIGSTFRTNSSTDYGGAIYILPSEDTGTDRIVIKNNTFGGPEVDAGNVSGQGGGAIYMYALGQAQVTGNTLRGNIARFGGGASIDVGDPGLMGTDPVVGHLTIKNNTVRSNRADSEGGGLQIYVGNGNLEITGNRFKENELNGTTFVQGGGLHLQIAHEDVRVKQLNNLFRENRSGVVAGSSSGGGEHVQVVVTPELFRSTNDRFLGNVVEDEAGHGGGLAFESNNGASLQLRNTVVMGNSVGASGAGGGVSVNCDGCLFSATFDNATISNNTASTAEPNDQIFGSSSSVLQLDNSIVYAATGVVITGFIAAEILFSDVCVNGAPPPGDGNFCADPLLKALLNFHQTATSPTIDMGDNSLLPSPLKKDPDGDKRKLDGNGDGAKTIDVGADERKA